MADNISDKFSLLIGTYSPADEEGIFVYEFNSKTGKAIRRHAVSGITNPSFITLSPDHTRLYAVSETGNNEDGHVYAYRFNQNDGTLEFINKVRCKGNDPCNIITDQSGQFLFVANYTSGSLSVLPVKPDGAVDELTQLIQHTGHSVNPERQAEAHVHSAALAPDNKHLFAIDLGVDKIFGYIFDVENGQLAPGAPPFTKVIPGSGPRLMEFSGDGRFSYAIHEMGGQITVFSHQSGQLKALQTISNLPENYTGKIWAADIHLSPDDQFLYATNRDDLNDIVTYRRDIKSGKLTFVNRQPTGGKTPRNFVIAPDGKHVLIGHKNGPDITIFKREEETGILTPMEERIPIAHAVCLKMLD